MKNSQNKDLGWLRLSQKVIKYLILSVIFLSFYYLFLDNFGSKILLQPNDIEGIQSNADSSSKYISNNLVSNLSNMNADKSAINSVIDSNGLDINERYSKFPLNLIPDLNVYIDVEIIFLIILCNVLFTSYLLEKNINFDKYIKNESINKWVKLLYNRYLRIWSTSKWVLIVWSLICLIICVLISKIILITLLS